MGGRWGGGRGGGVFFFKQKTAYELYQCDWSSDVCSSDLKKDIIRNIVARVQVVLGMHSKQVSATGVHYPQPCMSYVGVAVSSKARGKGVGKKFNSTFLNICENSDRIVAVRSTSHEDNVPACRIYVDLGWKEVAKNEAGYIEWLKVFDENK